MIPLIASSSADVERIAGDRFRSVGKDPRFVFPIWLMRPKWVVFALEADDCELVPKIYFDRGGDFEEADSASPPPPAPAACYCVELTPAAAVRRLRFDPCNGEGTFRFRAAAAWRRRGLDRLLAALERRPRKPALHEVNPGPAPPLAARQRPLSVARHYARVMSLAQPRPIRPRTDAPLISFVVPVFDTPVAYLNDLLTSFARQAEGLSEMILSDDGSRARRTCDWLDAHTNKVRVLRSAENRGIVAATNAGLALARGEWIAFVDHDDALSPGAASQLTAAIEKRPQAQFIYTDEVLTDERLRPKAYFFKPAYDPVLLSGVNYVNHLSCYKRAQIEAIGGLRPSFDGSQDYDLLLRYLEGVPEEQVIHVPYPAYQWRRSRSAFSVRYVHKATRAARRALAMRYGSSDRPAVIEPALTPALHRVRFDKAMSAWPTVSVVIPNRDAYGLIARVLTDLTTRTDYPGLDIVVTDNGSTDERVLDLYRRMADGPTPFVADIDPGPFNFARQVNRGIRRAFGDLVLLLNNDIEVVDGGWLKEMASCFAYPRTGIVGARLLYPNGRLQHAGVIIGMAGLAGHWFSGMPGSHGGPMQRLHVRQSLSAVTGACMLISRSCLEAVGPFDEEHFAVAYNDVDFCLRAAQRGFRIVWTPFASLVHRESATRGSDETRVNAPRFEREKENLRALHATDVYDDRAFSPWYSRDRADPRPVLLDRLPEPR